MKTYSVHISPVELLRLELVSIWIFEALKVFLGNQGTIDSELQVRFEQDEGDAYRMEIALINPISGGTSHIDLPESLKYGEKWKDSQGAILLPTGFKNQDCIDLVLAKVLSMISTASLRVAARFSGGSFVDALVNDFQDSKRTYTARFYRPKSA